MRPGQPRAGGIRFRPRSISAALIKSPPCARNRRHNTHRPAPRPIGTPLRAPRFPFAGSRRTAPQIVFEKPPNASIHAPAMPIGKSFGTAAGSRAVPHPMPPGIHHTKVGIRTATGSSTETHGPRRANPVRSISVRARSITTIGATRRKPGQKRPTKSRRLPARTPLTTKTTLTKKTTPRSMPATGRSRATRPATNRPTHRQPPAAPLRRPRANRALRRRRRSLQFRRLRPSRRNCRLRHLPRKSRSQRLRPSRRRCLPPSRPRRRLRRISRRRAGQALLHLRSPHPHLLYLLQTQDPRTPAPRAPERNRSRTLRHARSTAVYPWSSRRARSSCEPRPREPPRLAHRRSRSPLLADHARQRSRSRDKPEGRHR
jgi:hypothetical protein